MEVNSLHADTATVTRRFNSIPWASSLPDAAFCYSAHRMKGMSHF
jgi:hypothetical protein